MPGFLADAGTSQSPLKQPECLVDLDLTDVKWADMQDGRLTWLDTMATRCANLQVEMDSSSCSCCAVMLAIMTVLQLPPKLSRST